MSCFYCEDTGFIPYADQTGELMPCDACLVCLCCSERFPHAELSTVGAGGPVCEDCAKRFDEP